MLNKLRDFLATFEGLDSDEKAMYLIDLATEFQEVDSKIAIRPFPESNRVPACESEAFVWCQKIDDKQYFHFAVENPQGISAKAMAQIIILYLNGIDSSEVKDIPEDLPYKIFGKSLSMGKGAGLTSLIQVVKFLANN